MIRVMLVDDQPVVRQGLRMRLALERDVEVVAEAGDGSAALELARRERPDVVVMDVEMPGMDGITATEELRRIAPASAVVILSIHEDAQTRARAQAAGAAAFVGKHEGPDALLDVMLALGRRDERA